VRLAAGLALAAVIAWFQPFDLLFATATFDQPALRATLIVVLALIGAWAGREVGLPLHSSTRSLGVAVLLAVGMALACAAVDLLFRPALHPDYARAMAEAPLGVRLAGFMLRAVNENILYRLFLGSVLALALGRIWRDGRGRPAEGRSGAPSPWPKR
jgi:hypothetical protein